MARICKNIIPRSIIGFLSAISFLFSIIVIVLSIWALADQASFKTSVENVETFMNLRMDSKTLQILEWMAELMTINLFGVSLLVTVLIISCISVFGFIAAIKDSRSAVIFYGILLFVVILLQIGGAALDWAYESEIEDEIKRILKENIVQHYDPNSQIKNSETRLWDVTMTELQCCGVESYKDFKNVDFHQSQIVENQILPQVIPEQCCIRTKEEPDDSYCLYKPTFNNSYYETGCYNVIQEKVVSWRKDHRLEVISGIAIFFVIQLIVLISALTLAISLSSSRQRIGLNTRRYY